MRKSILILLLFAAACTGPTGPAGPTGETGVAGEDGETSTANSGVFSGEFNTDGDAQVWIPKAWTKTHKNVVVQVLVESPGASYNTIPIDVVVVTGVSNYIHIVTLGTDPVKGAFVFFTGHPRQKWWLVVIVIASQGGI